MPQSLQYYKSQRNGFNARLHLCILRTGSDGKDWTITARGFANSQEAEKHGLFMMPTPGCFGFAVIAENDLQEGWQLRLERSMLSPQNRVIQDDLNNYKITSF